MTAQQLLAANLTGKTLALNETEHLVRQIRLRSTTPLLLTLSQGSRSLSRHFNGNYHTFRTMWIVRSEIVIRKYLLGLILTNGILRQTYAISATSLTTVARSYIGLFGPHVK